MHFGLSSPKTNSEKELIKALETLIKEEKAYELIFQKNQTGYEVSIRNTNPEENQNISIQTTTYEKAESLYQIAHNHLFSRWDELKEQKR